VLATVSLRLIASFVFAVFIGGLIGVLLFPTSNQQVSPNNSLAQSNKGLTQPETERAVELSEPPAPRQLAPELQDQSPALDEVSSAHYFRRSEAEAAFFEWDVTHDMLVKRSGRLTESQRERYNELHIIAWNPRVGADCTVPDGGCSVIYERDPSHPYELLSLEELEELPIDDVAAPYFIARKAKTLSIPEIIRLVAKSAALADKPGDLLQYGYYAGVRGTPDAVRTKYITELIAYEMGDERSRPGERRAELEAMLDREGASNFVESANEEAEMILKEMELTRQTVFGLPLSRRKE
jgi:hypothetical protein